jgi:hypothetical protein
MTNINTYEQFINHFVQPLHDKPNDKTCALVFNSHSLLDSCHGELIDQHDVVVRFSLAPTAGFEKRVGSKTTHRILACVRGENIYFQENDEQVIRLYRPTGSPWARKYHEMDFEMYKIEDNKKFFDNFIMCGKGNDKQARIILSKIIKRDAGPTTGLITMLMCMEHFNTVNLFGFEEQEYSDDVRYHYYDDIDNLAKVNEIMKSKGFKFPTQTPHVISGCTRQAHKTNHPHIGSGSEKQAILTIADNNLIKIH